MSRFSKQPATFLGIGLVLLSAFGLAVQNVILRLFFTASLLFGQLEFGGFVVPQFNNIVLLLALRMATMTLMLACLAPGLYPGTLAALLALPRQPKLLGGAVGSGMCLFLGLTLLYGALSQVAAGIAIATFFIYPAITVLLAWRFFHQRPRAYQLWLMVIIFLGVLLTSLISRGDSSSNPLLGGLTALGAGFSFGLYGIFAERTLQAEPLQLPLHPVPFSLFVFAWVSLFAGGTVAVAQLMGNAVAIASTSWRPVLTMTLLSAVLTLIAYVLNNFGIRYVGASLTALISASTPALTALFAWWVLQEALQPQQLLGVALITLGVAALSAKAR